MHFFQALFQFTDFNSIIQYCASSWFCLLINLYLLMVSFVHLIGFLMVIASWQFVEVSSSSTLPVFVKCPIIWACTCLQLYSVLIVPVAVEALLIALLHFWGHLFLCWKPLCSDWQSFFHSYDYCHFNRPNRFLRMLGLLGHSVLVSVQMCYVADFIFYHWR